MCHSALPKNLQVRRAFCALLLHLPDLERQMSVTRTCHTASILRACPRPNNARPTRPTPCTLFPPDPERPHRPSGTPPSPVSKPAGSSSRPAPGSRQVSARQVSDTGGPESTSRKKRVRVLDSPTMPPLIHSATPLPVGSLDEKRVCMDSRNTWPASGVHRGITSGAWPIPRCGTGRFIRLRIRRQERGRSCRSRNWSLSLYC